MNRGLCGALPVKRTFEEERYSGGEREKDNLLQPFAYTTVLAITRSTVIGREILIQSFSHSAVSSFRSKVISFTVLHVT